MAATNTNTTGSNSKRQRSELKYPKYTLTDSIMVPKAIHEKGGGASTLDELAAHLGYRGTNNGAFLSKIGAARHFGLIDKAGDKYVVTQLGQNILMPVYDWTEKEALVTAFLNVELFSKVYEEYKGKQLPPELGMKNALKTIFKVAPNAVELAFRVLMDSAEKAGFFETRGGAKTHLIIPTKRESIGDVPTGAKSDSSIQAGGGVSTGSDGSDFEQSVSPDTENQSARPRVPTASLEAVKARYVQTLIDAHEEKVKKGDLDDALMSRIEKLLGLT